MDYKTTILSQEIEVTEELLPEISGLVFGVAGNNNVVFDYTAYFENNEYEMKDYKVFMRTQKNYIEAIAKYHNKLTSELFFQNKNGHILIASELVFLFLAFANDELLMYFNSLLSDVIGDGVAFSNSYIYNVSSQRLPTDILKRMIAKRENGEEDGAETEDE